MYYPEQLTQCAILKDSFAMNDDLKGMLETCVIAAGSILQCAVARRNCHVTNA